MCVFHTGGPSSHIKVSIHAIHDRNTITCRAVPSDAPLITATLEQVAIIFNEIQLN